MIILKSQLAMKVKKKAKLIKTVMSVTTPTMTPLTTKMKKWKMIERID